MTTNQTREMYLYLCDDCCLVFGVETAFEDHSQIVCPVCQSDEFIYDAGTAMATLTREPEGSEQRAKDDESKVAEKVSASG